MTDSTSPVKDDAAKVTTPVTAPAADKKDEAVKTPAVAEVKK